MKPPPSEPGPGGRLAGLPPTGLCGACAHALINRTRRGPVYLRCGAASTDDRLPRYPRLPVVACPAHQPLADEPLTDDAPADDPGPEHPGPDDSRPDDSRPDERA